MNKETTTGTEIKEAPLEGFNQPIEEYEKLIDSWIFNEDYRRIMHRKLIDDKSYEQIAAEMGMSAHGVFDAVKTCKEILMKHI